MKYNKILLLLPLLISCNSNTNQIINETKVKNSRLNYNVTYTGMLKNGKPDGEGTFKYRNNDTLTTFIVNGQVDNTKDSTHKIMSSKDKFIGKISLDDNYNISYIEGTYDYGIGVNVYTGKFKDNLFNDPNGKMKLLGNSYYVGSFVNGSNIGETGTIYYENNQRNGLGILYFTGVMKTLSSFVGNQLGYGQVKYNDDSVYTGQLLYTGSDFLRKGYGEMDFSNTNFDAGVWGSSRDNRLYKYVGEFDYSINGWIYGNGIMYYKDSNGNPTSFAKGYFSSCHIIGEYQYQDFKLIEGYDMSMESKYLRFREDYDKYLTDKKYEYKHHKYLFVGSSYMEFMNSNIDTPFSKYFGEYDALNVGCGGSTTADWLNYYETLVKPYTPDTIIMHTAGNDYANNASFDMIEDSLIKFIEMVKKDMPNTKIYFVTQIYTVATQKTFIYRDQLNDLFYLMSNKYDNVKVIDTRSVTLVDIDNFVPVDNLSSYFLNDGLHMNDKGYQLWSKIIRDFIDNEGN